MAEDNKRTDITINGSTATWEMRLDGQIHGTYIGTFTFKCYLNPSDTLAAGRDYRGLLGPNPAFASENDSFIAYALSQLKYRIISSPPFWGTSKDSSLDGNIPDLNVISAVLEAATDAEILYRDQLTQRKNEALEKALKAAEKLNKKEEETPAENED